MLLPAQLIEPSAFLAERAVARSPAKIFDFDVIAGVALGVVVADELPNRVPRGHSRHFAFSCSGLAMLHRSRG